MSALLDSLAQEFDARWPDGALVDARRESLAHIRALDLPTPRSERWRYTPLRALAARKFEAAKGRAVSVDAARLAHIPAPRIVLVNGTFDRELSLLTGLPPGVALGLASNFALGDGDTAGADDVMTRLNAVFAEDGADLVLDDDVHFETPVHWVFVSTPYSSDLAVHARHAVILGRGARATLVEHHVASEPHRHLLNQFVHVHVADAAQLVHVRIQDEDEGASLFAHAEVEIGRDATYRRVDLELGAALSRHELDVSLAGTGARFESGGVLVASQRRHLDTRLSVVHAARDTSCDLTWRGAAAGRSRVAFHGGILIPAGSDGTAAALSTKNLLLSDHAEIDAQPVLEIHADEVTASHGATVGRLDPKQLFYLRSRGIDLEQARSILTAAFGREALAPLGDDALVEPLAERLRERLAALDAA